MSEKKGNVNAPLPIAVIGTNDPIFRKKVGEIAVTGLVNVVDISEEETVKSWMLRAKSSAGLDKARKALSKMITDADLQETAYRQAIMILEIITDGTVPADEANGKIGFSQTELVKKSTLSHKKAAELLDSLERMGKLRWISSKRDFVLLFSADESRKHVLAAMENDLQIVKDIFTKYVALIDADNDLTAEQRKTLKGAAKTLVKNIMLDGKSK